MDRLSAIALAVILGVITAFASWVLTSLSSFFAVRYGAVDQPTGGRKIHTRPVPLWGGVGIALAIIPVVLAGVASGAFPGLSVAQAFGYLAGVAVLLVGGMVDDRRALPPAVQILFPSLAAVIVIASGTGIVQVTNPAGAGGFSLVWTKFGPLSLPSDVITFAWLLVATYAMKVLDGLDGLVAGLAVIGSGIVGALSLTTTYFLPSVGILSGIVGGAFAGFLPRNVHPARQFLGESGATIAGFSVGVLAILSSAKIAIALAVLAIPIADAFLVMFRRIRTGVPWYRGDDTHLHFRLLKAGIPHRAAVLLLWGVSAFAGVLALILQTRGKLFLVAALVVLAALASYVAGLRARQQP